MQPAELPDQLVPGAKEQVVGIGEDDGGMEIFAEIALAQAFDGGLSSDRHENRGRNVAVFRVKDTGAGAG